MKPSRSWRSTILAVLGMVLLMACVGCSGSQSTTETTAETPKTETPAPIENGEVVRQVLDTGHVPQNCPLSKSSGKDHVRWYNETDDLRTITFLDGHWPFLESSGPIQVQPKSYSAWYTLDLQADRPSYRYKAEPPLKTTAASADNPPDEPTIGVGD